MKKILEKINCPEDLKKVPQEDLNRLAAEIRAYLIEVVSETGGHLGSNLGVVELTIALHYVFDSPTDKLIWDVGHQSYIHKILTDRKESLKTIRQFGGLSGFTKRNESVHDSYGVGHSSTSISSALGFAVGRDMLGEDHSVVAIIGDGALTAGMALEGLNNGARMNSNFIVILNDNQMSIATNVGGMAQYLDRIRTGNVYREIKGDVHKVLDKIPYVGKPLTKAVKDVKGVVKQILVPGMFFEEMGYTYLGPIDGHSISQTMTVLRQAKKIQGPVLVHLNTVKGKGYRYAEKDPSKFHGVKPFETSTGKAKAQSASTGKAYSQIVSEKLNAYADEGRLIAGITAAMPDGTGLSVFSKRHPKQFFDVGIAEQHAVTFAAGLALQGIKPFVAIYSTFLQRAYDQILHDICIQMVPVVFLLDRAGIVGEDGETHQGNFDLSFLNHMPNMSIAAPRDLKMFEKMMDYSLTYMDGPLAIRYPKGKAPELGIEDGQAIIHGQSQILALGKDLAIIAVGSMVEIALEIRDRLLKEGIEITVVDAVFTKPMDCHTFKRMASSHKVIVTMEENALIGGFASELIRQLSKVLHDNDIYSYGIKDEFVTHGSRTQLLEHVGLDADSIMKDLKEKVTIWQ